MGFIYNSSTSGEDPQALEDLNLINGSDKESLSEAIAYTDTMRDDLADELTAKGVPATHDESLTELVPKIGDIEQGGGFDWGGIAWNLDYEPTSVGEVLTQAREHLTKLTDTTTTRLITGGNNGMAAQTYYYSAISEVYMLALTHLTTTCFANVNTTFRIKYYLPSVTDVDSNGHVFNLARASEIYMPSFKWSKIGKSSTFFRTCDFLKILQVGEIDNVGTTALDINGFFYGAAEIPNLRLFDVGYTDRSLLWLQWSATNVIAEGEASQLELINNARTGLYERVYDHSGEENARSIAAAWISTLADSEYESVQDALLELQIDFSLKGWLFA